MQMVLAFIGLMFLLSWCSERRTNTVASDYGGGPSYYAPPPDYAGTGEKPDGTYDCTVSNLTRGYGPYSLSCEKDGDDVTIHFNNGGYITLNDGFEPDSGDHWEVELE